MSVSPKRTSFSPEEKKKLALMKPETKDELWNWVYNILNIRIPRKRCCAGHDSPFDAFAASYFAEDSVVVWKASRGFGGKTYMLSALSLAEQITLGAQITLLGGSQKQSKNIHDYISGEDENARNAFWDSPLAPRFMREHDPNKTESRTTNGGKITALTASQKSVRGPHPQRLRFDEVDEADESILDASMGQTMGARGIEPQTTLSSTHQNHDGTMSEVLDRAETKGWPVYHWCYEETREPHGWLSNEDIQRKRRNISASMWEREYDLEQPTPEDPAIQPEAIEKTFDPLLGEYAGANGEEVVHLRPHDYSDFFTGTDWAKSDDWTIITTFKETNSILKLAAWLRIGRKPWPAMVPKHNKRVEKYGGESSHDATGVGGVVDDFLNVQSEGFDFRRKKDTTEMLNEYIGAMEDGRIICPHIKYMKQEHETASNEMVFGNDHLPDSIASGALAYRAYKRAKEGLKVVA